MEMKFNLKSSKLLNKKFKTEISGYSANEVDQYLDQILEDYRNYEALMEIKLQETEDKDILLASKEEEINTLKVELSNHISLLNKVKKNSSADIAIQLEKLQRELEEIKKK